MWHFASSCVFSGALAAFAASRAFAADPPCSPIAVAVDASVRARWPELPGQVRQAFETRTDIDSCARVELALNARSIAIGVILPDGRSASREVARQEDVLPTLEALLLVPRPAAAPLGVEASAPSIPAPAPTQAMQAKDAGSTPPGSGGEAGSAGASEGGTTPSASIPVIPVHVAVPERDEMETRRASYPPSRLRIELSVLTEARIGDGQRTLGLGALSLLDIGGWLVGFEGRADRDQQIGGGYAGSALELAALGGRRVRFQNLALDLVGGPAVALRGAGTAIAVAPARPGASPDPKAGGSSSQSSVGTVPRALLGAHLIFGARSSLRAFIGVDGEFGPANAPGDNPGDPSRLPVWTLGLALGATVGTR
jgi:hypothetical protein